MLLLVPILLYFNFISGVKSEKSFNQPFGSDAVPFVNEYFGDGSFTGSEVSMKCIFILIRCPKSAFQKSSSEANIMWGQNSSIF